MKAMLNAYPPDHFKVCMQEALGNETVSFDYKQMLKQEL
jgi:hypothetical protein